MTWNVYFNHSFFNREKKSIQNFKIEKKIGNGTFGPIYEIKIRIGHEKRALQIIEKELIKDNFMQDNFRDPTNEELDNYINNIFINKIDYMIDTINKEDKNNNSVKYYEYFEMNDQLRIVMELCDDNLLNYLEQRKNPLNSREISIFLKQLNNVFIIMEKNHLIHGSLNLENILIKYENVEKTKYKVKLKLSKNSIIIEEDSSNEKYQNIEDNLNFIAPELLNGGNYNKKCDLWSLGIIIYFLYFKKYPYNLEKDINQINNKLDIKTDSPELDDLIKRLLVKNQGQRMNWKEYFNHPFFK